MLDLDKLRSLGDQIQPPSLALLEETARRRDRRAAVTTVGSGLAAALVVVAGVVALQTMGDDRARPDPIVTPTPTPQVTPTPSPGAEPTHQSETSMTPREVVQAENAEFLFGGVSADDPDFAVSVWTAECTWCPLRFEDPPTLPTFNAMAITTDGWRTATYRRPPMGAGRPFYVQSPAPDVLLVVDDSNGGEYLVRRDGSAVLLPRVVEERMAASPRQWFTCLSGEDQGTWCAYDVEAEVVYEWRGAWSSSAVSPVARVEPWGRELLDSSVGGAMTAWWYEDGVRRTRILLENLPRNSQSGAVLGAAEGDLLYWAHERGDDAMQFFVGDDLGESWRTIEQQYPADVTGAQGEVEVLATPFGSVVLRQISESEAGARTRLWRLDSLEGGDWELVHDTGVIARGIDTGEMRGLTVTDGKIWTGTMWSDDIGRTWVEVDRWR